MGDWTYAQLAELRRRVAVLGARVHAAHRVVVEGLDAEVLVGVAVAAAAEAEQYDAGQVYAAAFADGAASQHEYDQAHGVELGG